MTAARSDTVGSATGDLHRALLSISEAIVSHRDLTTLFQELAAPLHQVVRFEILALVLHVPASNTMRLHILDAIEPVGIPPGLVLPVDDDPAGWVWQTQQPLIISDLEEEMRWPRFRELARPTGGRSCCQLPLTTAVRRLGALVFGCKQPSAYDSADLDFLQLVANLVAVAIDNALAFQEIAALKDQLSQEKAYLEEEARTEHNFGEIVGRSDGKRRPMRLPIADTTLTAVREASNSVGLPSTLLLRLILTAGGKKKAK